MNANSFGLCISVYLHMVRQDQESHTVWLDMPKQRD